MPTHLLYQAWKKSLMNNDCIYYNTSDGNKDIVKELRFVDPREHKDFLEHEGMCYLCGEQMTHGLPIKKAFSNVYTDWNIGKHRTGTHVCEACCFALLTTKQRYGIRMYSFVANESGLQVTNRKELRDVLIEPPNPPFVACLAVSQQKHLITKAEVNYSRDVFTVMYEEMPVIIDRQEFTKLLTLVQHYLYGFSKTEIGSGNFNQKRVLDFGIDEWQAFEKRVKVYRGNPLMDVVMFVAQKNESEEELHCFMVSELKVNQRPQLHLSSTQFTEAETETEDRAESGCGGKSKDLQKYPQKEQLALDLF